MKIIITIVTSKWDVYSDWALYNFSNSRIRLETAIFFSTLCWFSHDIYYITAMQENPVLSTSDFTASSISH